MNRIAWVLAAGLPLALSPRAAAGIPEDVRAEVTQRVEQGLCPTIVVGVVDSTGAEYFFRGALPSERSADENTLFEIGSITKAFTATVLADMAARKVLALDDPVTKFLPDEANVPERAGRQITLRDLSMHRSGLPRLPDLDSEDPANPYAGFGEEDLLDFLKEYELPRDVGAQYEYSNLGAGLLGFALARKAGMTYEALVVERIAHPLGLGDTRVTLNADQKARLAPGHANGKQVPGWDFDALAGAGALRSSARDLLVFVAANAGLKSSGLDLVAMRVDRFETGVEDLHVALGWHVWTKHGRTLFWHNGGTGGYRSFCGFDPDRRTGVVVLTNSTYGIDDIGLHALEPLFPLEKTPSSVAVSATVLEAYDGYYELGPGMLLHITHEGDHLYVQLTGQDRLPLYPESETRFFCKAVEAKITFVREGEGAADLLILHQNGDHTARRKVGYVPAEHKEIRVDPAVLARYVGVYELAPGMVFDVRLEGERLMVKLADQPRFPVFAESDTKFFYKVVEATLTFTGDGDGPATGAILDQGGVKQTARRVKK